MNRHIEALLLVGAALAVLATSAQAGPCTADIAQFEEAVRQSANNPNAGPMAPQTVGAQIDREPTPASIARAKKRAQTAFAAALARAKRLDARGDRAGCARALQRAKGMYNL
jgi:hypothetical protein